MTIHSPLLTAREAAEFLRVSIHTLRGWTSQGRIPVVKVGRRALYRLEVVEKVCREGLDGLRSRFRQEVL
uniref:DNA-binding protein n=1 Tax=Desulfobacca acetoxidans TaxID=60893 RepID=A0A7V4G9Y2_9BACT